MDPNEERIASPDAEIIEKVHSYNTKTQIVNELFKKYNNPKSLLGIMSDTQHEILLYDNIPIKQKPYSVPMKLKLPFKKEIERLLKEGLIRKSTSQYSSPAFPIIKHDGSIRLVIDYRKLNAKTIKQAYPFPNVTDQLLSLNNAVIFSTIDLYQGYYQIAMHPNSVKFTAFVTPDGLFEFLRMPFGLCNAPRTFQQIMNEIFFNINYVRVFLDDILVFSTSKDLHLQHLEETFRIFRKTNATINIKKSNFSKMKLSI